MACIPDQCSVSYCDETSFFSDVHRVKPEFIVGYHDIAKICDDRFAESSPTFTSTRPSILSGIYPDPHSLPCRRSAHLRRRHHRRVGTPQLPIKSRNTVSHAPWPHRSWVFAVCLQGGKRAGAEVLHHHATWTMGFARSQKTSQGIGKGSAGGRLTIGLFGSTSRTS